MNNQLSVVNINDISVGDNLLFQLKHWSISNWHDIEVLYKGSKYIVMYNKDRKEEYCIDITSEDRNPVFIVPFLREEK